MDANTIAANIRTAFAVISGEVPTDAEVAALTARVIAQGERVARVAATRQRCDALRERTHAIAADRKELARLDLQVAAREADVAAERAGSNALGELRAKLRNARAEQSVIRARQNALAAEYGGTTAGRDARRAALHQARHLHAPLPDGHRAALARSLADGCRTMAWAGNGQAAQFDRITREAIERAFGVGELRTMAHLVTLPDGRPLGSDLNHSQDGNALVIDGVPVDGAVRDGSRDEYADAVRKQGTTWVPGASRVGTPLQRGGMTGLQAWAIGQALIDADDAAARAAAKAEEQAALADKRAARLAEEQARRERLVYARG